MHTENLKNFKKIHRGSVVFDGLLMWNNLDSRKIISELIEGNISGVNYTVAHGSHNFKGAMGEIGKYRNVLEDNSDLLELATTAEDIEKAKKRVSKALLQLSKMIKAKGGKINLLSKNQLDSTIR